MKTNKMLGFLKPKSKVLYDRTPGTISNITGLVNEHELSIQEIKTLENLAHKSIGIYNSATPGNPSTVAGGGTAVFRVVELVQWEDYNAGNRADNGDLKKSIVEAKISIKESNKAKYEIESLDLDGLGFGSREAYIAYISSGTTKTLSALMDAYYIDAMVQEAIVQETADANTPILVKNPNWFDLANGAGTQPELEFNISTGFRQVARAQTSVARQLTLYDLGSDQAQYGTILHKDIYNDFLLVIGGKGATNQKALDLTGAETEFSAIAGISGGIKDHVFLGQNIPAGTAFSKDRAFDFSKIAGATSHKEAFFVAMQGLKTTSRINGAGNQEYISKFNVFQGPVRKTLFRLFVTGSLLAPAK